MVSEHEVIDIITSQIPSGENRETACYESDAELLRFDGPKMLLTTDEFSAEDLLPEQDGYVLGWNIATGAISDIVATGGRPLYYTHALTASKSWDKTYITRFARGIAAVLKEYNITFAGGDVGIAEKFRCTATVIGKPSERVVIRKGIQAGDRIYISGKIGAGNLNAALTLFRNNSLFSLIYRRILSRFTVRPKAIPLISKYATGSIDTSDGLLNGLSTLADLNSLGFTISKIPYLKKGILAAKILSLPKELLFIGECGEYELLFAVSPHDEKEFLKEASKASLQVYPLGEMCSDFTHRVLKEKSKEISLAEKSIRARDFPNRESYIKNLIEWIKTW